MSQNIENTNQKNWFSSISEWIVQWDNAAKSLTWITGIIGGFLITPPGSPVETTIINKLTGFLIIITVIIMFYFTSKYKKHYHASCWMIVTIIFLIIAIGGLFFKNYNVCNYEDGKTSFIMGYGPSRNGNAEKPHRDCEQLIHDIGNDNPANIWTVENIERMKWFVTFSHLITAIFLVVCVTSAIQIGKCLIEPDLRKRFTGRWLGQATNATSIELIINVISDRNVSGAITFTPQHNEGVSARIEGNIQRSNFIGDSYLKFTAREINLSFRNLPQNSNNYLLSFDSANEQVHLEKYDGTNLTSLGYLSS